MSKVTPPSTDVPDAADDAGDLPVGAMVGEYRVEKRIGSGGMGIVFAAAHPVIGKRVAIKVLRADVCDDAVAVQRFIDEARVVNQIEHPNIVDIFAFGQIADGRHYFVMEWLRGESLRDRIERKSLTLAQTVDVLLPLVRALAAAHELGIVHRDLKPDNVFIVEGRDAHVIKLLDFGVAKLSKPDLSTRRVGHTATGTIVGTPQYLSPEQAKGTPVDHRADIYALGAIAFEALTGRPPFIANTVMEVVAMHLMEKPVRPSTYAPGVPFQLDELVLAALAKDPAERPTLAEWRDVLEGLAAQLPPSAMMTPIPRPRTPLPFPIQQTSPNVTPVPHAATRRRVPRGLVSALVALPAIAAGIVVFTLVRGSQTPAATPTPTPPTIAPEPVGSAVVAMPPPPPIASTTPVAPIADTGSAAGSAAAVAPAPVHHHHHGHGSAEPAAAPETPSQRELLPPGSIPRSGSAAP